MNCEAIRAVLQGRGLISAGSVEFTPLSGGVSSEIYLVQDGARRFVVKKALPQLKVPQTWLADVSRNRVEQQFMEYVSELVPGAVLKVLSSDPASGFFVMEYLGEEFRTWKEQLLGGLFDRNTARTAAGILATMHERSWNDPEAEQRFQTADNFHALRIEPYLLSTGRRHPALQSYFEEEAGRLFKWRQALVHGDFSPKNIMVGPDRLVLLDHEVAWFGDPAFDVAFFLNHLFLKSLLLIEHHSEYLSLASEAYEHYFAILGSTRQAQLGPRIVRLLPMLMLARVDGKSPVEYFVEREPEKTFIRSFVHDLLPISAGGDFTTLQQEWKRRLFDRCK